MFIGHAALAFAFSARIAAARGWSRTEALTLGLVAAAFATVPDIDMLYAPVGLLSARLDALSLATSFWSASTLVHRGLTHSLVVSVAVAFVAVLWFAGSRRDSSALGLSALLAGGALVVAIGLDTGGLGAVVATLFAVASLGVAAVTARRTTLTLRPFVAAALFGLLSHPFGDVFTGEPPAFFYPFDAVLLTERVALSADPTLHLLGAFAVELTTIWLAVLVVLQLSDIHLRASVTPRVALASAYAASVFVLPPPTLDLSYPFVFSVLAVGSLGVLPKVRLVGDRQVAVPDRWTALVTALAAVSVAWAAYAVAYLVG